MSWPTKAAAPPAMSCGSPNSAWLRIAAIKTVANRLGFGARASRRWIHAQDARAPNKLNHCFFFLCFRNPNCLCSLVERCGSMLLRDGPLVQVVETQNRKQHNKREGVRGDVESEVFQAV